MALHVLIFKCLERRQAEISELNMRHKKPWPARS